MALPLRRPRLLAGLVAAAAALAAVPASAQRDPVRRRLFQGGGDVPLSGGGPLGAYAFYYHNEPGFRGPGTGLRLAVAPVYADAEYGKAVTPRLEYGLGLAGGGFAFDHAELRDGRFLRGESFRGHGLRASASLYPRLDPGWRAPLWMTMRLGVQRAHYLRETRTDPAFALPPDQLNGSFRIGLRLGGEEPMLYPDLAGELSAWHETLWRERPVSYGFSGDRELRRAARFNWARILLALPGPERTMRWRGSLTAGASDGADRITAWRLGGSLPFSSEFPLSLPGYFDSELSARRFALAQGRLTAPIDQERVVELTLGGAYAWVDYLPGFSQGGGQHHPAVSAALDFGGEKRGWKAVVGWGHGFRAIRSGGKRGANSMTFLVQWDLRRLPIMDLPQDERRPTPTRRVPRFTLPDLKSLGQ